MGDSVVDLIVERLGRAGSAEFVLFKKQPTKVDPPIAKVPEEILEAAPLETSWIEVLLMDDKGRALGDVALQIRSV